MPYRTVIFCDVRNRRFVFPDDVLEETARCTEVLQPILTHETFAGRPDVLAQADFILSTWGMPRLSADFLAQAPKLKAVFYAAGTVKGFVTEESWARGITISSAAQANAVPVAEYTFSTIILSLKRFWDYALKPKTGLHDQRRPVAGAYRTKVGLVSLGAIARRVVGLLRQTDVEILAFDPFCPPEPASAEGVRLVSLEQIFEESDVISLHTPWLPETEGMINADLLRRTKTGCTLINTARGALINETDLCRVLAERPDLTAILDVTHPEPPAADSPLLRLDNVVLTPHIAGSQDHECARMGRWMVEEMQRYLSGEPLRHEITQEMLAHIA